MRKPSVKRHNVISVGNRFTGVTATSCNQRHRESNYNDVMVKQKNPCAVPRFSHRAFRARKAFQSRHVHVQNKSIPFHVKLATQHSPKLYVYDYQ